MSGVQLWQVNPDVLPVPPVGAVLVFVDQAGVLSHKNSDGQVVAGFSGGGGAGAVGATGPQGVPGPVGPAGAGGAGVVSRLGMFAGACVSQVGAARYYPAQACIVSALSAWAGGEVVGDAVVTLKKNGVAVGSCVIADGVIVSGVTALNVAVSVADYLTIDLACNVAADVCARIDF